MKRLLNILRAIFISPEFIALLFMYALLSYFPIKFGELGELFIRPNDYVKYIVFLPTVFTGIIFTSIIKSILLPEEKNKALYQWENYILLRDRVMIGVLISIICSINCFLIFLFQNDIQKKYIAFGLISSIVISGICTFTMYFASIVIREILILTDKKK